MPNPEATHIAARKLAKSFLRLAASQMTDEVTRAALPVALAMIVEMTAHAGNQTLDSFIEQLRVAARLSRELREMGV